ncbi:MAG: hypothetical protein ACYDER_05220 [Ktedonobacteraceae bacterium]
MIPPAFNTYFATIAGAGAALVGLLFVAISIAPEQTVLAEAPLERQAMASSCFIALSNPFLIALIALIPNIGADAVGLTTLALSMMGIFNIFILGWFLLRQPMGWRSAVRRTAFVLIGLGLYGGEFYAGKTLLNTSNIETPLTWLAALLVGLYVLGLSRAWDLLGAHRYRFQDLLKPLHHAEEGKDGSNTGASSNKQSVTE